MKRLILIAGATGYVGGELLKSLLAAGYAVRCLARRPRAITDLGYSGLEVVAADVLDAASVHAAMDGVETAYYLVHSMGSTASFEQQDRIGAQNFADAARDAGVQRIVYLGGLGHSSDQLSAHLRSRQEVGEILKSTGVPVIEFRASVVIGSGSLSFEMIRALVERLPIMIAPRWVSVAAQPIAIADLLSYLVAVLQRNQSWCIPKATHQSRRDHQGAATLHESRPGHRESGFALAPTSNFNSPFQPATGILLSFSA